MDGERRLRSAHLIVILPGWYSIPLFTNRLYLERRMHGRVIVVTHEDGSEEEFPSIVKTVVALNVSSSTINKRLKDGEPYLWRGEKIKFRYK